MAIICEVDNRCEVCPMDQLPPDDQFPLYVDSVEGADGSMPLPTGEVGINITADDVALGLPKRMQLKTETGTKVKLLRINGLCTKVSQM